MEEAVRALIARVKVADYKYSGAKIDLSEGKKEENKEERVGDEDTRIIAEIRAQLNALDLGKYKKLRPADFEKDDDSNHHIDFITSSSNLRCFNYHIKETTRANCRMVAGRIIPAIATTTAMITGFVLLEVLKQIQSAPLAAFRAVSVNLGTNVYCIETLPDPKKKKTGFDQASYMQVSAVPENFTCWDKIEIDAPDITLEQFLELFTKVHFGAKLSCVTSLNGKILYSDAVDVKSIAEAKKSKVIDLLVKAEGPIFPPGRVYCELVAAGVEDKDGNSAIVPNIKYIFKH